MDDPVVYRSRSRIERIKGPVRRAYLPAASEPVFFGMHDEVAEHYNMDPEALPAAHRHHRLPWWRLLPD